MRHGRPRPGPALYVSGVRVSELCGLKWCDALARQEGGQITVFGKGARCIASPPHRICRCEKSPPRAEGLDALDAPRPRRPRTRPQRADHLVQATLGHASASTTG